MRQRNFFRCCLSPLSCSVSPLGALGEKAWSSDTWSRWEWGSKLFRRALCALYLCSIGPKQACPPSDNFRLAVIVCSPISRFSGKLQFGPPVEVVFADACPHSLCTDIHVEAATTLSGLSFLLQSPSQFPALEPMTPHRAPLFHSFMLVTFVSLALWIPGFYIIFIC